MMMLHIMNMTVDALVIIIILVNVVLMGLVIYRMIKRSRITQTDVKDLRNSAISLVTTAILLIIFS